MIGKSLKNYFRRDSMSQKLVNDTESILHDSELGSVRETPFIQVQVEHEDENTSIPTTDYESTVGKKEGHGMVLNVKEMAKMFSERSIQMCPQLPSVICQESERRNTSKVVTAQTSKYHDSLSSDNASAGRLPITLPEKVQVSQNLGTPREETGTGRLQEVNKKKKKRRPIKCSKKKYTVSDSESCESETFNEESGNWTLRPTKRKKDKYIKITMDDLKTLLSGDNGIKNGLSIQDIAMKMRRIQSTENDFTDTETLNSILSYSSGTSEDALLPGNNRASSLHLVNPTRVGILKRFLPFMNTEESQSSDSTQTVDTHLCEMPVSPLPNYHDIRRKSLQPEMLRNYPDCLSHLHSYTDNLKGTSRRSPCLHESCSHRLSNVKPMKASRCGVTFEDGHYYDTCYEDEFDPNPHLDYRSMNLRKPAMASLRRMPTQPGNIWNTPMNMPMNGELQMNMGFSQPSQIVQQVPVPMVVNPRQEMNHTTIPGVPGTISNVTANLPQNQSTGDSILQQLHDALNGTLDSTPTNSSQSEDSKETKKEENSLEAHFSRIRAVMAEKKKLAAENQPFQVARVTGLVANALLLLCAGGIVGIGISIMINKDSALYTGVTKSSQSDQSFQYFCYIFCLIGGILVGILVCGFCGSIKTKQVCLKLFMIAVGVILLIQVELSVFLYLMNSTSVPMFSSISSTIESTVIKQLRDAIVNHYTDGSVVATAWDNIQIMAECCGCEGADDYKMSSWKNATTTDKKQAVPNSCCVLKEKTPANPEPTNELLCHTMTSGFWHKRGCIEVLKEWYHSISILTLSAVGGLVVIEILCIIFAARLLKKTNEKKEREKKQKTEVLEKEKAEKENTAK